LPDLGVRVANKPFFMSSMNLVAQTFQYRCEPVRKILIQLNFIECVVPPAPVGLLRQKRLRTLLPRERLPQSSSGNQ